jgi:hypothetical protein
MGSPYWAVLTFNIERSRGMLLVARINERRLDLSVVGTRDGTLNGCRGFAMT